MITIEKEVAGLKFGSDLVVEEGTGQINHDAIEHYAGEIEEVQQEFSPLLIVSGAVAAGIDYLERNNIDSAQFGEQELASIGSDEVSKAFKDALIRRGIVAGLVLANHNQMQTGSVLMHALLHGIRLGKVHIINENDQENIFELKRRHDEAGQQTGTHKREKKPGVDNDLLAARAMVAIKRQLQREQEIVPKIHLVLFTEIGGFMLDGVMQPEISARQRRFWLSKCDGKSDKGTGGMAYKVGAAFYAAKNEVETSIASPDHRFKDVLNGVYVKDAPIRTRVVQ